MFDFFRPPLPPFRSLLGLGFFTSKGSVYRMNTFSVQKLIFAWLANIFNLKLHSFCNTRHFFRRKKCLVFHFSNFYMWCQSNEKECFFTWKWFITNLFYSFSKITSLPTALPSLDLRKISNPLLFGN